MSKVKISRNCLEGYLTPDCATCPDWADGTDDRGIGCATRYPISWCESFNKVWEEDAKNEQVRKAEGRA